MKRMRLIGLALVALFAMGALASASASAALPEFSPAKGVTLTGTSGKAVLETLGGGTKVECSGGSSGGEITGEKTVSKVKITFTGCKSAGFACTSGSDPSGTLLTNELTGTLGYISKANKEVGILFKPTTGKEFIEFNCVGGIVKVKVLGLLICPITPVNLVVKEYTLKCEQKEGDQKPTKFEGGEVEVLKTAINGGEEQDSAEEATAKVVTNVASEILA